MPYDLFSERKRLAQKSESDVYVYDVVPGPLRIQITHIARDAIGPSMSKRGTWTARPEQAASFPYWNAIHETLCREYGVHALGRSDDPQEQVLAFFELHASTDQSLDVIELIARTIDFVLRDKWKYQRAEYGLRVSADQALEEINFRFRRAACGYQYENGKVIRVDSQHIHSEVVKPALLLLQQPEFNPAQEEFLQAHLYFRNGDYEDSLVNAGKCFESVLKIICTTKGWNFEASATASKLIEIVFENNLLPKRLVGQMQAVRATLEQGLVTLRNSMGGHGQGPTTREVPGFLVAYALHLTAAAVVMLVEAAGLRK